MSYAIVTHDLGIIIVSDPDPATALRRAAAIRRAVGGHVRTARPEEVRHA